MIDRINNARLNPPLEGRSLAASKSDPNINRYFTGYKVNVNTLQSQFNSYPSQPPMIWNPELQVSARAHSADMDAHQSQSHTGSDGSEFYNRNSAAGYPSASCSGENVYSYAYTPYFAHVGFNVDWGVSDLGHRQNIMNFPGSPCVYTEVGIGITFDNSHSGYGPYIVTQEFGRPPSGISITAIGGIVYNDNNNNNAFDSGEGIGSVIFFDEQNTGASYFIYGYDSGYYRADLSPGLYTIWYYVNGGWYGVANVQLNYAGTINKNLKMSNGKATSQESITHPGGGSEDGVFNATAVDLSEIVPDATYNNTDSNNADGSMGAAYPYQGPSVTADNGTLVGLEAEGDSQSTTGEANVASRVRTGISFVAILAVAFFF